MRLTPARTAILQALSERLTLSEAMRLLEEASASGHGFWSFDTDPDGVPPAEACARAVHQLLYLEAATVVLDDLLNGVEVDPDVVVDVVELLARLVYVGHAALRSNAASHGYDPRRRIESMHVEASMQVARVLGALEAGAGHRCVVVGVEPIAAAVATAMLQSGRDEVAFVDAAVQWAGASLGLYAIAGAASE